MATQQQFYVTPNPLISHASIRGSAQRKSYLEPTPLHSTSDRQEILESCAKSEAKSWKTLNDKRQSHFLEETLLTIEKSIEAGFRRLGAVSSGNIEFREFAEGSRDLRQSLRATKNAIQEGDELPCVETFHNGFLPRTYSAVVNYMRAVDYDFQEQTFEAFFYALQEVCALETTELWSLKPYAEMALLEQAAGVVQRKTGNANPSTIVDSSVGATCEGTEDVPSFATVLASLRRISGTDWKELIERINLTDRILRDDPSGAYPKMDFESRDSYRNAIGLLAKGSKTSEPSVARKAVELAATLQEPGDERLRERQSHVGYYLIAEGRSLLQQAIGFHPTFSERLRAFVQRWPDFSYILSIEILTAAIMIFVIHRGHLKESTAFIAALFLLPAAECAVSLINQLVATLFPPKGLPKLDFSKGIPAEFTTLVAVPTLLTSESQVHRAVRELEIRFLANRDANLHFALVTDPPDSAQQFDEKDKLADECAHLVQTLNEKYGREGLGTFLLFHRHRTYNSSEGVWMGWERKRGKLLDLNDLLLGSRDSFPIKVGDLSLLPAIKYVITLDLDTQLPRDTARKLLGTIAHPLNRAIIDPVANTVTRGYGILQPRVDISIQSANRSRLAAIFSADVGFDIYTRAVSDVYQDLFGEGSFTGKGIYEVSTFQQVLNHRFPCNTILSHDMIEGGYARAGLVSDVEVVDDYPSHMSAFSRRKHRWVRGDWQIVFWLLPRVPDFFGRIVPNPLSVISRWKIIDNLRRSLTEIGTFLMLVVCWMAFPAHAVYWTLATLSVVALPTYTQFAWSIVRAGSSLFTADFWKNFAADFGLAQANLFMRLVCLCHQSLVTIDAVVRAVVRMTLTHERLMEWETAAEAETNNSKKSPVETYLELTPWLSFFIGLFLAVDRPESFPIALPLLILWCLSKPIGQWLNLPSRKNERSLTAAQQTSLRQMALRTWRLFREFSTADDNWLIPDTVQSPASLIVHRTSTTNLGLLLNARLAAVDLGFLTVPEFAADTERTLDAMDRMPRLNGQMYNWYDTQTLEPVKPRFISTVDNGNLVCSLWTLKQGCLSFATASILPSELWRGVRDHLQTIEELATADGSAPVLVARIKTLQQQTAALKDSAANWAEVLPDLERDVIDFERKIRETLPNSEAVWWGHELSLRVTNVHGLIRDFAPWLLSQFSSCPQYPELVGKLRPAKLTLQSLPLQCETLLAVLQDVPETIDAGFETHSALQLLRAAVIRTKTIALSLARKLDQVAGRADRLAQGMDFASLFDAKKKQPTIGFDAEENRLSTSHYDLLASEARASTFAGIAKGEIPQETWFHLKRPYTRYKGEYVLLSWTGTMFEYLMPLLWMKCYSNTLLDHSARAAVRCQMKFADEKKIPWGLSEASCAKIAPDGHYHYEAFGVPDLAVFQGLARDIVVSPYSSFLALVVDAKSAMANIERMREMGWLGTYGFYEAADFTPSRMPAAGGCETVRCWLAHHQGMSLMSVANVLCNFSIQRRFHAEPKVAATERLLHEKSPRASQVEVRPAIEPSLSGCLADGVSNDAPPTSLATA